MASLLSRILIYILGYFIVAISLVPLIRNDNWVFRIFEYPRAQKLLINIILLFLFILVADWDETHSLIFAGLLSANGLYLFYLVFPYTILSKHQMKGQKMLQEGKHLKLLICNVYQDNRNSSGCIDLIRENDPDLVLLVETNSWWAERLAPLRSHYPYRVEKPLENTYGMMLFSKLELLEPQVRFLIEEGIPSIHTKVKLQAGDIFFLYCLHPQPPVPQENPRATERDAELLTIAKKAKACTRPVVVAGDLNDVAWSYTTELFMKISGLLDPRRGRGFFSTFHSKYWFLRWPLDHVFCSKHFHLINLKRLPSMGSDHFPILVALGLDYSRTEENAKDQLHADAGEQEVAEEKIQQAE